MRHPVATTEAPDQTSDGATASAVTDLELLAQQADLVQPGPMRRLERCLQILRYYRKSQIARRAWRELARHIRPRGPAFTPRVVDATLSPPEFDVLRRIAPWRRPRSDRDLTAVLDDLQQGRLTLLGESRSLGVPLDWDAAHDAPRLWRFHLHYHEYLLDLAAVGPAEQERAWPVIWGVVDHWIQRHPPSAARANGDAWHPYCISRRIPVWLQLLALNSPEAARTQSILRSLAQQAEFLAGHVETDLGGNHLLENVFALALAGCALDVVASGGRRSPHEDWLRQAEAMLRRQLPQQLLPHGEHYERSPMYHCQIAGRLLQTAALAVNRRPSLAAAARDAATSMVEFVTRILHPDGEIPLFADSAFGEAFPIDELRDLAGLVGVDLPQCQPAGVVTAGPYWIWRSNGDCLIFDRGEAAALTLPAHGHCDLLGFEASVAGRRWFVDSGLYHYEAGPMRRYCRSSIAHNVAVVEDRDHCDVWSGFRMGRRGRPQAVRSGDVGPYQWAAAAHNSYRRLGVGAAERLFVASTETLWACFDHFSSRTPRAATGRLHLAPGVQVEQLGSTEFRLQDAETARVLRFYGVERITFAAGWYCPRFGKRERTVVIQYHPPVSDRPMFGWTLSEPSSSNSVTLNNSSNEPSILLQSPHNAPLLCTFPNPQPTLISR